MYKIIDLQGDNGFVLTRERYKTKKKIIERLANFHNSDYQGMKNKDEYYEDISEFLDTLRNDSERLNWLCDYGMWEIKNANK